MTRADTWLARRHTRDEAFWLLTDRAEPDACWLWQGTVTVQGYGRLRKDGIYYPAHRISYEIHHGPIPDGYHVDHVCHNVDPDCHADNACLHRRCVNPAHLEAVLPVVNILRGKGAAAEAARRTRCPAGHPLSGDNLSDTASGYRICRACKRARATIQNAKVSAQRAARRASREMRAGNETGVR